MNQTSRRQTAAKRPVHSSGFTLIELLIVIAIIGILSSIILASFSSIKKRAEHVNVTTSVKSMKTALMLYYEDNKTWPAATDGTMVVDNRNNATWNQFFGKLSSYTNVPAVSLPYALSGGPNPTLTKGYIYMKGTEASPVQIPMYNGATGAYVGCIKIYEGYYLDALAGAGQTSFTLGDGGIDPDGIDIADGHYTVDPGIPAASCPVSSLHY